MLVFGHLWNARGDTAEALKLCSSSSLALGTAPVTSPHLHNICCKFAGVARACCIAAASVRPWNMPGQLQPLLSAWLDKQMSGFVVWVDRQLQQEDWKPLGLDQVRL